MGGGLCRQRSAHTPESRGKKKQRPARDCFLRGPCLLCFIVQHSQRDRDPPHSQRDPWEERGPKLLCPGLLRGPGLLCQVSPPQADMVCKRKNSGDGPQRPCKLPRSAMSEEPSGPGVLRAERQDGGSPAARSQDGDCPAVQPQNAGSSADVLLREHGATAVRSQDESDLAVRSQEESALTVRSQEESALTVRSQEESALTVRSQEESALAVRSQEESALAVRSQEESALAVRSQEESALAVRSQEESALAVRSQEESALAVRSQEESALAVRSQEESALAVRSQEESALAVRSQEESALAVRSQEESALAVRSQEESALAVRSQEESALAVRSQEESTTAVRSQEEGALAVRSQDEDSSAVPSQTCDPSSVRLTLQSQDLSPYTVEPQCRRVLTTPSQENCISGPELKPQDSCIPEPKPKTQEEDTEQFHIHQLPSSILLKIFSNLSLIERCLSASLVCKYWRDLCLDFQFWRQLDLSGRQQVKDGVLERITSRYQNLPEINISDCLNISDMGICKLAQNCPGLLRYTAYRCKQLSDTSLIALATHCPSLQKVHVGNQDRLTDEVLKQLGTKCRELKDVHFGQCYEISDEGLITIAKGSPKLQRIYMQENKLVSDESVKAFAEHCPSLQYVGFMGCSVTSEGVIHLTKLKHLSSLDLRHITKLDNETVMEVVRRCHSLTSLNLCLNRSINDRCVEVIAKEGQKLKELYLVTCKITDDALIAIGRYSMTIETVDVGWCKDITDKGATLIAQTSKSIRYLGLMRCDKVNEATVEQLVQQYPHITFSTVLQDCKRTLERAYQMGWTPNASSAT
ncbi:F-box/LRR-repeat protein 17 [Pelobates fuscus]|uniref:F-box/LRR-repeat protein 17 n=1 Tax=Pelobates fuscus TaxID=191477 RepID=UPI002FE438DC